MEKGKRPVITSLGCGHARGELRWRSMLDRAPQTELNVEILSHHPQRASNVSLLASHELQPRGNPLVYVFYRLHRGKPDGLVFQRLVRAELGKHTQAFPCHQELVHRLPWPHALAWMGLAPTRNAPLVKAVDLQLAEGGGRASPNSTLTARMTVFLFNGAMPASIMVTFG